MQVTPAILTDAFAVLQEQVNIAVLSKATARVHIDIVDGQFAENVTVTPMDLTIGDYGELGLDFHLIAEEPMDLVYELQAVAEYLPIKRVIGQVERMSFQADFLEEVAKQNWQAGLALDIYTPLESIDDASWNKMDVLLLMAHQAGFQNQPFRPQVLTTLDELPSYLTRRTEPLHVVVDGGIRRDHLRGLRDHGVSEAVIGSGVWESVDPIETLSEWSTLAATPQGTTQT
jgi:ribulose-phosphate 3-epimerase